MDVATRTERPASDAGELARGDAPSPPRERTVGLAVASPWARFWARWFDLALGSLVLGFALIVPFAVTAVVAPRLYELILRLHRFWWTFVFTPVVIAMEAAVYAMFGNTPGKRLLGLKVLSLEGERLELGRILRRNFGMYVLGLGMMLPAVPLFTLVRAYHTGTHGERQPWDVATRSLCYSVGNTRIRTWLGAALTVTLVIATFGLGAGGE